MGNWSGNLNSLRIWKVCLVIAGLLLLSGTAKSNVPIVAEDLDIEVYATFDFDAGNISVDSAGNIFLGNRSISNGPIKRIDAGIHGAFYPSRVCDLPDYFFRKAYHGSLLSVKQTKLLKDGGKK